MREERLSPRRADPADFLQCRRGARLVAPRAMALDCKSMRLVAYLLQQVQARMIGRQHQRVFAIGKPDFFEAGLALRSFRNADELGRVQPLLGQNFRSDANLSLPAVDRQQIRRGIFARDNARRAA